jgi:hypothetical protein
VQKLGAENPPTAFLRYSPSQYWVLHLVKIGWPGPSALSDHRRIPRRTCFPNPRASRSPTLAFIMPSLRPTILSYLEDHVAKRLANHKNTLRNSPNGPSPLVPRSRKSAHYFDCSTATNIGPKMVMTSRPFILRGMSYARSVR